MEFDVASRRFGRTVVAVAAAAVTVAGTTAGLAAPALAGPGGGDRIPGESTSGGHWRGHRRGAAAEPPEEPSGEVSATDAEPGAILIDPETGRPATLPEGPATPPSGKLPGQGDVLASNLYQIDHHAQCGSAGCVNASRQCDRDRGWCSVLWWSWLTGYARQAYSVHFKYAIYVNGHKVKGWQDYGHSEPGDYLWHGSWGSPTTDHGRGYYKFDLIFVRHFGPNDKLEFKQDGEVIMPGGRKYLLKSYGRWKRWD